MKQLLSNCDNFQRNNELYSKKNGLLYLIVVFCLVLLILSNILPVSAAYESEGMNLYAEGDYNKSIDWFENILESTTGKDRAPILNNIGVAYLALGEPDLAKEKFEGALEMNSSYFYAWTNLGIINGDAGNTDEAIRCYDKALELVPSSGSAVVLIKKANLLTMIGKYDDALLAYKKAETNMKKSDQLELYTGLGVIYTIQKNFSAAEEAFNRAIKMDPDNAALPYYDLGLMKISNKEYYGAKKAFEQATLISPSNKELISILLKKLDLLIANNSSLKM